MEADDVKIIVSILALVFTALNFVHTRFQVQSALNRQIGELIAKVEEYEGFRIRFEKLEGDIRENKKLMDILWGAIEDNMTKLLMHHSEPYRDKLLAKLRSRTLRYEEALELKAMLDVDLAHEDMLSDLQIVALPWVMAAVNKAIATTPPDTQPAPPTTPTPLLPVGPNE